MAAAIKAINAKIRSNPYTDYFCSTRTCDLCFGVPSSDPGTPVAPVCNAIASIEAMEEREHRTRAWEYPTTLCDLRASYLARKLARRTAVGPRASASVESADARVWQTWRRAAKLKTPTDRLANL